jgi:hypothetical protein
VENHQRKYPSTNGISRHIGPAEYVKWKVPVKDKSLKLRLMKFWLHLYVVQENQQTSYPTTKHATICREKTAKFYEI